MKQGSACAVIGGSGRMGQRLCRLVTAADDLWLCGATEVVGNPSIGQTLAAAGLPGGNAPLVASLEDLPHPPAVIVDFTFPEVTMATARFAARTGTPLVIGTTGFSPEQRAELARLSTQCACVCAPNMSLGVNLLFRLVAEAAALLNATYDAEIVEMHHRHKQDAPSGTAVRLAEILAETRGVDLDSSGVFARHGMIGPRRTGDIGVQTLRGGDVVGEHTVLFAGTGERIELTHRAQSRDCFAQGAVTAARWLMGRAHGLYDMQDVLGLRR